MRILNVNSHALYGGAERVVTSLHDQYLSRGLDSWLAVGKHDREMPNLLDIDNEAERSSVTRLIMAGSDALGNRSQRTFDGWWTASRSLKVCSQPLRYVHVARGFEDFDFPASHHLLDLPPAIPAVVHLHNLHGSYFDLRALPALTSDVPTIATLHDAWLLTGHCVHPFDCTRWRIGCGSCPYLRAYVPIPFDRSAENHSIKRKILSASRLRVATPSQWLMNMVIDSPMAESFAEARVIPNGVDTDVFRPASREEARNRLGLPQDRNILLFSARNIETSPWKDFETLVAALCALSKRYGERLLLVTLGAVTSERLRGLATIHPVPFEKDPDRVAQYYQAADVYVHAARAENAPLAVIEAMACGTPVVASAVGGVPELIEDGVTGRLVKPSDTTELAEAIDFTLNDSETSRKFAAAASAKVAAELSLERQADAYIAWYEELSSL